MRNHHIFVHRMLCDGGASVNLANARGDTALHDAVTRGDAGIVKELLARGAEPTAKNRNSLVRRTAVSGAHE
jgi:ankyrin repeat protein